VAAAHDLSVNSRTLRSTATWLLVGVVLAQAADLLTFIAAIRHTGIRAEQNLLARSLFLQFGDAGPVMLKGAAIILLVMLLRRVVVRYPRLVAPAAGLAMGIGVLGFASNVAFGLVGRV
jgi:hypothetical protein